MCKPLQLETFVKRRTRLIPIRSIPSLIGLTLVIAVALPIHLYGAECPRVTVCFTPGENRTQTIVQALGEAKSIILAQAYSFTSAPIAKALLDAHKRGVQVQVILDKSQRSDKYSSADFLANQGVSVVIDANHAIAHNKIIVIDGELVLTGSFNFTKAAQQKNAENLLLIRDSALVAKYTQNWEAHRQHSQPYVGRGVR
jgi:phosphatidylserine/phosphatidylglycerophosphate/cardiolipin synthase-like enzyme